MEKGDCGILAVVCTILGVIRPGNAGWRSIMENDWSRLVVELTERLNACRELLRQAEGALSREPFPDHDRPIDLRRCLDLLADLRKQEEDLLQVGIVRRAFEEKLRERLRAENRAFVSAYGMPQLATEEEIAAGLQELKDRGGLELDQFIGELEQVLTDRERAGT
jgi:hypothetical protein